MLQMYFKRHISERIFNAFNILLMILLCAVMLFPYLNQLAISLNEPMDTMRGGITVFPRRFTLINYTAVFNNQSVTKGALISVTRTLFGTALALITTFSAAYALTRRRLKGRKLITWFLCIPMYISAGTIPIYMLFRYLGLMNNYLVYILPFTFSFYNMVIIRSFLQELPPSLEESALIDGANEIRVMFQIILPLAIPVIATVCLWVAVFHWNDWTTPLLYVTKTKLYPLQYVMMRIIKESEVIQSIARESAGLERDPNLRPTPDSIQAAVLMVSTLPIVMLYPFLQKYFIQGVTLGAVKE